MAAKKNTAQAYELLYRMAQEKEQEAEARRKKKASTPGTPVSGALALPPDAPVIPEARMEAPVLRVDRAPLLQAQSDSQGASARASRARRRRPSTSPEATRLQESTDLSNHLSNDLSVRREGRSLLAQLDAARARSRQTTPPPVEARELLLRDDVESPSPATGEVPWADPRRAAVDPVLLGEEAASESWGSVRRGRLLEVSAPTLVESTCIAPQPERSSGDEMLPFDAAAAEPGAPSGGGSTRQEFATGANEDAGPLPMATVISQLPPEAALPALPATASRNSIWASLRHAGAWVLGSGSSRLLDRRIEVRVSSLLVLGMSGIVVTTLVLTYLRLPGPDDPLFRSRSTPAFATRPSSSPATTSVPRESASHEASSVSPGPIRHFPRWGPGMSYQDPGASPTAATPAGPFPEIRDVVVTALPPVEPPAPAPRDLSGPATPPAPVAQVAADGELTAGYRIQVRAKESEAGAHGILDYLSLFGFEKPLLEEDPRGDRSPQGDKLYTVFVGRYADRTMAQRECDRLKRETRARPYKNRPEFFQDCLVITRSR